MVVNAIGLENFRNYTALNARFCPGINVITGDNAQGKTNLLEAIAYLSACRSHRARADSELIRFEAQRARLEGEIFSRNRDFRLEVRLGRGVRRQMWSNGVRLKNAGELTGILKTVLFCPEDLDLIRAGAAERRKFLDGAICQLRPRYGAALAEYKRLLEQKRRILRDWPEKPSLLELLEDYNLRMCQTGALVIHYRAHFVQKLNQCAPAIHASFSNGREELGLGYQTVKTVADPLAPASTIFTQLQDHMAQHRQAELEARSCLSGPHKDDLLVDINGRSVRTYGSQGQTRTAALSLELAQREIFYDNDGEYPVLLLDDVLSELDQRRQEFVLNRIQGGQVFITCCESDRLSALEAGQVLRIENGALLEG
ncbi:MAG: DNA replication/repair protein RecF [Clostridiales bacterium]|nr:DNA replication/repair protein RecF [Clostridiales bacterium]